METETLQRLLISALPILIAITFHEVAHGYVAFRLGDPTAKMLGRLTLNPLAHIDIFGTIILPLLLYATSGVAFGYAKPVPINISNLRNPRVGSGLVSIAGPLTNIILFLCSVLMFKLLLLITSSAPTALTNTLIYPLILIFHAAIIINLVFALLNMIPIPPIDGGRVLMAFFPYRYSIALQKYEFMGMIIVFVLLYTGIFSYIIWPPVKCMLALFSIPLRIS